MGTKVGNQRIIKKNGCLYYLGKDGYVWEVPMKGKPGEKKRVGTELIQRKPKHLYYLGKDGYVGEAQMGAKKKAA